MSDRTELDRRLAAVERAVVDGDGTVADLPDVATFADRLEALERTCETLESQVAELEAATQALRGYVGNVRSVNDDVEQRADAALAAVDRLESRLESANSRPLDATDGQPSRDPGASLATEMPSPPRPAGEAHDASESDSTTTTNSPNDAAASTRATTANRKRTPVDGADDSGDDTGVLDRFREAL